MVKQYKADEILSKVKDVRILQDAKNFKQLDTSNSQSCTADVQNLTILFDTYKKLTEVNLAAGTLYRDLIKKYNSSEYANKDELVWNVKSLPGIEVAQTDNSNLIEFKEDSEILKSCKEEYDKSVKETYAVLRQASNAFGKLKRDFQALVNDSKAYIDLINADIDSIEK